MDFPVGGEGREEENSYGNSFASKIIYMFNVLQERSIFRKIDTFSFLKK